MISIIFGLTNFLMQLPFFYLPAYDPGQPVVTLDEDTSRHVVQVLRMKEGEMLNLTDGSGHLLTVKITEAHRKHCTAEVIDVSAIPRNKPLLCIAISLLKNPGRFEWFLEKATETGVSAIVPLLCERTEKEKFRHDRLTTICISAMLQSRQCWLPELHQPVDYSHYITQVTAPVRYIAHCEEAVKQPLHELQPADDAILLIGPEGDFSPAEIELAQAHQFIPVSLGNTRLRTETAGVAGAVLLRLR